MKRIAVALTLFAVTILTGCGFNASLPTGGAHAEKACNAAIDKTVNDWGALRLEPGSKPTSFSKGVGTHEYVQAAVDSMRYHLAEAKALCKDGKDDEALLQVNVIRAFLELPEIQHPTDHRYLFEAEKK